MAAATTNAAAAAVGSRSPRSRDDDPQEASHLPSHHPSHLYDVLSGFLEMKKMHFSREIDQKWFESLATTPSVTPV